MKPLTNNCSATRNQLAQWSTLSRNAIGPLLVSVGITPLRNKFPMNRIYEGLLGLSPSCESEQIMVGKGLMRLGDVADLIHVDSEVLLDDVRNGKNGFPPLFVFGPRRHLFLKAQIDEMRTSPRNAWHEISFVRDYVAPQSRLASIFKVAPARIKAVLENKNDPPAHIISNGVKRYILASVAHRLNGEADSQTPAQKTAAPSPAAEGQSLFAQVTHAAAGPAEAPTARTASSLNAHGGDNAHAIPAEAKLSGT